MSERGGSVRLIGTLCKQAVCKRCCYFRLGWANCKIFTRSLFSCHHPASCCHSIPGKVAGRSFECSANLFGAPAVCQALEAGVRSWKTSVLSCTTSLTSNFFFAAAVLSFPRPCWPTFLLSPCPTSVSQYCLCGSFLLFRRRCVLQTVLPLFSGCGDVFKVTLPFCL